MTAIQIIAASTKQAGIRLTAFPDYNGLVDERNSGKFDLVINNDKQLGPTPYTFYDYLFHLPIAESQTFANFARFTGAGAAPWALTLDLNKVHPSNVARRSRSTRRSALHPSGPAGDSPLVQRHVGPVQHDVLDQLPDCLRQGAANTPSVWNGYLNMTGIDAWPT